MLLVSKSIEYQRRIKWSLTLEEGHLVTSQTAAEWPDCRVSRVLLHRLVSSAQEKHNAASERNLLLKINVSLQEFNIQYSNLLWQFIELYVSCFFDINVIIVGKLSELGTFKTDFHATVSSSV